MRFSHLDPVAPCIDSSDDGVWTPPARIGQAMTQDSTDVRTPVIVGICLEPHEVVTVTGKAGQSESDDDPNDRWRRLRVVDIKAPLRSAKSTITCFRSPSSGAFEVRVLSARCLVRAPGSGAAVPAAPAGLRCAGLGA
jgi:hypothetical protein